jgi:benzodiazapine receptor
MLWTPLFFGLHQKGLALVDILALTGTVGLWAKQLYNLGPIPLGAGQLGGKGSWSLNPAWFTVPYLAWLSYGESLHLRVMRIGIVFMAYACVLVCSYLLELGLSYFEP